MANIENLDALIAAPRSHKLLFENNNTRVLEVIIEPGEKEPMHTHILRSVMIVTEPARLIYHNADNTSFETTPSLDVKTEWMEPEQLHAVENIDDKQYKAIRVEIK